MVKNKFKLTVVIPVYNEEKILAHTLNAVIGFLKSKKYSWQIIVVDDGSKDSSAKIAKSFFQKGVKLLIMPKNSGKGAALRAGILSAEGETIIFSDCDLSVPIEFTDSVFDKIGQGYDVVIGSRRIQGSVIKVHQPPLRETMGRVYTFLTQLIMGMFYISDFTCGFKGFSATAAKKIFSQSLVDRWAYDSEILFLAKLFGFKISEVPVTWQNRSDTRVVLKKVILESFLDLFKIRLNLLLGKYK